MLLGTSCLVLSSVTHRINLYTPDSEEGEGRGEVINFETGVLLLYF